MSNENLYAENAEKADPAHPNALSLRLTERFCKRIDQVSNNTGLSKQEIMRLSAERGIDTLLKQIKTSA